MLDCVMEHPSEALHLLLVYDAIGQLPYDSSQKFQGVLVRRMDTKHTQECHFALLDFTVSILIYVVELCLCHPMEFRHLCISQHKFQ